MPSEGRTFGYCRASTARQTESPETQKEVIKKYAAFNELGNVTYFVDAGISGKIPLHERPSGAELLRTLRPGDSLIITKIDRAFRNLKDCCEVLEEFSRRRIRIHICDLAGGSFDLTTPMGKFLIQILAAVAELERAYASERTKEGLRFRKVSGARHTRHAGYGFNWVYQKNAKGKKVQVKVPDDDERDVMKKIAIWRIQDEPLSWSLIAEHLRSLGIKTKDGGVWDENRIRRACRAEFMLQSKEQRSTR